MTNPIDNGGRVPRTNVSGVSPRQKSDQATEQTGAPRRDPGVGSDASLQSGRLQSLRETIDNTPEVDTSRVEQLRDQIANGDYPLDPERIASRFVEFEKLINE